MARAVKTGNKEQILKIPAGTVLVPSDQVLATKSRNNGQCRKGKGKRKNSGKQHVKFNPSNPAGLQKTTDFLANMADPVKPFLIPRLVPTEAVPNNFRCVKTITPDPAK